MKKISVALTGSIGSGKSTVATMLAEHGAQIVSGDELGKLVLSQDSFVREKIRQRLGQDVFNPDGTPNRPLIASRVFSDSCLSSWLTSVTFPAIHLRWKEALNVSSVPVTVLDAALIFEWKIECEFDVVISVIAAPDVALSRSSQRFSREDFLRRMHAQLSPEEKAIRSHVVIKNDGDLGQLTSQVSIIWQTKILPLLS